MSFKISASLFVLVFPSERLCTFIASLIPAVSFAHLAFFGWIYLLNVFEDYKS
jgi:hypothetical protein